MAISIFNGVRFDRAPRERRVKLARCGSCHGKGEWLQHGCQCPSCGGTGLSLPRERTAVQNRATRLGSGIRNRVLA